MPTSLKDDERGLQLSPAAPSGKVSALTVIYGANASGKSNIISALQLMAVSVQFSHSRGNPNQDLYHLPFALDPACSDRDTTFELDFVVEGVRYHYGFGYNRKRVSAEWLSAFPEGKRRVLFERTEDEFSFGRGLRGKNKTIAGLTRSNSLFLSASAQNDHEELTPVAAFFRSIVFNSSISVTGNVISNLDREVDVRAIEFLARAGTGIVAHRLKEVSLDSNEDEFQFKLRQLVEESTKIKFGELRPRQIVELAHATPAGDLVYFDAQDESAGTRRLLLIMTEVFRCLDSGAAFVIDELDASLHTQACEAILAPFRDPEVNKRGAQLVATTHDTNLMRSPVLRRDQIWFTEKDELGASHVYPLSDIRVRKDDNIEKGYLQGRFGAVPFAGSTAELFDQ